MTRATLAEVLTPARRDGYAVAGLVCQGWEDARAYVAAAEAEDAPVILQAGPGARAHIPVPVWGAMFRALAEGASVPVVAHLDHGYDIAECRAAIEAGFTSVMYDGSALPLEENIARTAEMAAMAHEAGVSCEGEIGVVGYADGTASSGTDPEEAARFARETGVDAVAVSIGNVHLQRDAQTRIDRDLLARIEAGVDRPLVLHGGSGLAPDERAWLARETSVCKLNIGTELRQAFGGALRGALAGDPALFDRIEILTRCHDPLVAAARHAIAGLR